MEVSLGVEGGQAEGVDARYLLLWENELVYFMWLNELHHKADRREFHIKWPQVSLTLRDFIFVWKNGHCYMFVFQKV